MSQISGNPAQRLFVETMKGIAEGVCSFAPLVSLFKIRDTVMTLDRHYQLLPLYSTTYPQKMLLMIARQLGKTTNLGTSNFIRSATLPFYHSLVIQPRFDQIVRFNATIYQPVGNSCLLQKTFIKDNELSRQSLKRFNNGSITILGHMYLSVNHLRGLSGLSCVVVDESVPYYTEVVTIQHTSEGDIQTPTKIQDVKAGDICVSFGSSGILHSVVSKDASYHGFRSCFRITTRGGRTIDSTSDHSLPTSSGRMRVSDIIRNKASKEMSIKDCLMECSEAIHQITRARTLKTALLEDDNLRKKIPGSYCVSLVVEDMGCFYFDPIVSIEYIGELPVYDIEVEGTHNYVLANGICSYNCQDINRDFLPIVQETMSASEHWATMIGAGTPTTTDTTLGLEWEESSQAEWVTKCQHCNHYNIPNPRQDIVKMIGKNGSICAKCGRPLNPIYGKYVHAYPDRQFTYPGYHISQTIHPMHCMNPRKWPDLLYKVEKYSEMALYNEVFGWPYDISVVPLTKKDVMESRNKHNYDKPEDIPNNLRDSYRYISVGIDWDGGGALSVSFTNIAVCGLRNNSNVIDCIYGERIKKGKKAKDVSRYIMGILDKVQPDIVGYDAGGAGFLYRQIMIEEGFNELLSIPFKYSSPSSGDVIRYHKGVRDDNAYYYSIDKSRSLSILIEAVKAKAVTNPWFEDNDDTAEPLELLALIEMPKTTATGDTVYLIGKKSGVPDDYAHALNFGCAAIWDHFNNYPKLGDRYDTSALVEDEELQKKEELWDDLSDWSKYLGEINGPTFTPGGF